MKKGFLLQNPGPTPVPVLVTPVECDECPVCLEPIERQSSLLLPCRHVLCVPCTRSLWQLRRAANASTVNLECPVCRSLHSVRHGDFNAFIASHAAANFADPTGGSGGGDSTSARAQPTTRQGLETLTVPELLLAVRCSGGGGCCGIGSTSRAIGCTIPRTIDDSGTL